MNMYALSCGPHPNPPAPHNRQRKALDRYRTVAELHRRLGDTVLEEEVSEGILVGKAAELAARALVKLSKETDQMMLRRSMRAILDAFRKAKLTPDFWHPVLYAKVVSATKWG